MILALGLAAASLAACGGEPKPDPKPVEKYSDKVLAISEGSVHAVGGWTADNWVAKDGNKMEATSVKAVSELSTAVADKLAAKELDFLYVKEVNIGTEKAGWDAKCKKDGKIYVADGSYTLKALCATYDAEEETYIAGQWIPDPHTAHAEALNENIFFPTWTEAADEEGFEWSMNPVVIGGAGTYVQVVAKYKAVSAADVAGFGMAMIKKSAAAEGTAQKFEEYVAPSTDSYGICGTMNDWSSDEVMTQDGDVYSIKLDLEENAEFKVRLNGGWDKAYGSAAVDAASPAIANFDLSADNIKCTVAGKYSIVFDAKAEKITLSVAAEDTYSIIGSMNGWGDDIMMTKSGDLYSADITLEAETEFKVRLNKAWDVSYGFADLDPECGAYANFADKGGNILCNVTGEYTVSFSVGTEKVIITAK